MIVTAPSLGILLHPKIAGPTYCAVASMELMGVLDKLDPARRERLVEWCVKRQVRYTFGVDSKRSM